MRSVILTLTLGAAALGLVGAPAKSHAQQLPPYWVNAQRFGNSAYLTINSTPIYRWQLNQWGLQQMLYYGGGYRTQMSPFGMSRVWTSPGMITTTTNPWFGTTSQMTTPAINGLTFNPYSGLRAFTTPGANFSNGVLTSFHTGMPTWNTGMNMWNSGNTWNGGMSSWQCNWMMRPSFGQNTTFALPFNTTFASSRAVTGTVGGNVTRTGSLTVNGTQVGSFNRTTGIIPSFAGSTFFALPIGATFSASRSITGSTGTSGSVTLSNVLTINGVKVANFTRTIPTLAHLANLQGIPLPAGTFDTFTLPGMSVRRLLPFTWRIPNNFTVVTTGLPAVPVATVPVFAVSPQLAFTGVVPWIWMNGSRSALVPAGYTGYVPPNFIMR